MARTKKSSPRSDPLLSAENGTASINRSEHRQSSHRHTSFNVSRSSAASSPSASVGHLGHFLIVSLPLMACGMIIAILALLISNFQEGQSVQTTSISAALEVYQPYSEIVVLASFAAVFTFAVTAARNIQVAVSMQRARLSGPNMEEKPGNTTTTTYPCCSRFINGTSALINVAAYVGFILLVAFGITQEEPSYAILLHTIGAFVYFAGISIYGLANAYLLYQQQNYPRLLKWLFIGLSLGIVVCAVIFGMNFQAEEALEFEWAAVFLTAIHAGLFSVLFHIDNVDDEIRDFFGGFFSQCCDCCCCRRRR